MRRFLNWLRCSVFGHPCVPTGRHGIVLQEWRCLRCSGVYISHADHGNLLVPANEHSDLIFHWRASKDRP